MDESSELQIDQGEWAAAVNQVLQLTAELAETTQERDTARAIAGAAVNFLRPAELRLVLMTAGIDVPDKAKRDELLAIVRAALECGKPAS